ncbi:hypothetical protein PsYK624_150650 [Phanerochaete sordida]|uniref:Uncharacterized protein n=1 Tax=Phanerochaete sordida TaxID=48140 RepID=A0A9P3GPQ8_9APHY|nr:hypothetical protein PsYK624_150650 [Phanerochaete sordida]
MVANGWRGTLSRSSTRTSASSLTARTSAVRRWLASLPRRLSAKSRTRSDPTQHTAPTPDPTSEESHDSLVARLAHEYGVPPAEAAVYALLRADQRAQMWAAEVRTRLYYAQCQSDDCPPADACADAKDGAWSDASSIAESAGPATPGGCEDWTVRVADADEVGAWGRVYALRWGFVEG